MRPHEDKRTSLMGCMSDWPVPPGVRAFMTTRAGGVSAPPFDSFNLGSHVRDQPAAVAQNRRLLAQRLGVRPVFLEQVHGTHCVRLDGHTPDGTVADACVTHEHGVACTVMVADCLPILLAEASGRQVAAVHAGWRGLAGEGNQADGRGVLEQSLQQFLQPSAVMAWLGPCIGPARFEVGADVRAAFCVQAHEAAASCFVPAGSPGKYLCDLAKLARLRLAKCGVTQIFGNDGSDTWCTVSNASMWFSHRRDAARLGSTGRMAACIWLEPGVG